ncbi:MAG: exopolysaccharide biosynthesis protein [Chroococcales cyanobacterium]
MAKLSTDLNQYFFEETREHKVSLGDLLAIAGERLFGFLFVILSLPSALPVPAPGYSIPFGIVLFLLAFQLILGSEQPWIPAKILHHQLNTRKVQKIVKSGLPWLKRIEAVTRPRFSYICTSLPGRIVIGSAIALMAISMMIPIPGTNTIPAIGIFVIGFSLLEEDGAISLAGLVVCGIALAVSTSIIIAVIWGGSSIVDLIKEWLNSF